MTQRRVALSKIRPRLADRIGLRLSDGGRRVDGLWIGSAGTEEQWELALRRVEEALRLIKTYDRVRYNRLVCDLERVWVITLSGPVASYDRSIGACKLDSRFVLAETSQPEDIAGTIVHEATHARLLRCGIGYEEDLRSRVEAVCVRRELAFAAKLPNGEQLREQGVRKLELCANRSFFTNASFSERRLTGAIEAMRYLGLPDWLMRIFLALSAVRRFVHRFVIRH